MNESPRRGAVANDLLAALNPEAFARVAVHLQPVSLRPKEVLYKPGEKIREIYFPDDAVIVMLAGDAEGRTIETATVGHEGASWISASVSAPSMPCETIVAIEGHAHKLAVEDLDEELRVNEPFQHVLTQYSHALLVASMRTTGCAGLHDVPQRCARWMLHTLDRTSKERFRVTHDFLAMLLGVRRPTLSVVMHTFEAAGIVTLERSAVTVRDRGKLEEASCECYRLIKQYYEEVRPRLRARS
jgi:CRP-like cAMP-binding protein